MVTASIMPTSQNITGCSPACAHKRHTFTSNRAHLCCGWRAQVRISSPELHAYMHRGSHASLSSLISCIAAMTGSTSDSSRSANKHETAPDAALMAISHRPCDAQLAPLFAPVEQLTCSHLAQRLTGAQLQRCSNRPGNGRNVCRIQSESQILMCWGWYGRSLAIRGGLRTYFGTG